MTLIAIAPGSACRESDFVFCAMSKSAAMRASGANIGRMYDGRLNHDALKNTSTKPAQKTERRRHEKMPFGAPSSCQVRRMPNARITSQGRLPAAGGGGKYYTGPGTLYS